MSDHRDKLDDKIDGALGAWPLVATPNEDALAAKTMSRIRANFPPKSKLTIPDDALLASPCPVTGEEWKEEREANRARQNAEHPHQKSSEIDVPIGRASSIPPPSSGVARSAQEPEKKAEGSMGQVERQRERTSFKDLAALAATPPPPSAKMPVSPASSPLSSPSAPPSSGARSSDSGVVDLQAAQLSDPGGAERAQSTPLASGSLFDEEAAQSGRPSGSPPSLSGEHPSSATMLSAQVPAQMAQQIDPYSPASVRPSVPPSMPSGRISAAPISAAPNSTPNSPVSARAALIAKPAKNKSYSRVGLFLGAVVSGAAIATGALFVVRAHQAKQLASADSHAAPMQVAAAQPAQPAQPAQVDQPATPAANTISAGALPVDDPNAVAVNATANNPGAKTAAKPHASKSGKPAFALKDDSAAKSEVDTPSAPPAATANPPVAKEEAPPPAGASASLQAAMQTAAGPTDSNKGATAATGPKFAPGSVPQRPSQGALASAIGRVLPDARACLGPDDGVSYANIVFESGGGVQNVALSGFAANKPAGACITTALKKASVGPFAEPTYSAKVTVRP